MLVRTQQISKLVSLLSFRAESVSSDVFRAYRSTAYNNAVTKGALPSAGGACGCRMFATAPSGQQSASLKTYQHVIGFE